MHSLWIQDQEIHQQLLEQSEGRLPGDTARVWALRMKVYLHWLAGSKISYNCMNDLDAWIGTVLACLYQDLSQDAQVVFIIYVCRGQSFP